MELKTYSFIVLALSACAICKLEAVAQQEATTTMPGPTLSAEVLSASTPTTVTSEAKISAVTATTANETGELEPATRLAEEMIGTGGGDSIVISNDDDKTESTLAVTSPIAPATTKSTTSTSTTAPPKTTQTVPTSSLSAKTEIEDEDIAEGAPLATDLGGIEGKSISNAHSSSGGANMVAKEEDAETELGSPGSLPNSKLSVESDQENSDNSDWVEASESISRNTSSAPIHLNMTQIDQVYVRGIKGERESVESWHRMGKKLKKGIGSIIGSIVPLALNMSQEAKISGNCSGAMLKWVLSMNQLKAWALRMLDASGKPIAGLLEGSMTMFGNYRQCLKVRAPDDDEIEFANEFREYFRGKYCIIQAKPWLPEKDRFYNLNSKLKMLVNEEENEWYDRTIFEELNEWLLAFNFVNIRYDVCVPSQCSREDIQKAVNYLFQGVDLKARVLRCETDADYGIAAMVESGSPEVNNAITATAASTNANKTQFNLDSFSQLGWLLIPVVATVLVVIATALSLAIGENNEKRTGKLKHTIKSFSLKRSVSSHLNVDYDQLADDKPLALYGVRFLLVLWVILVESAVNLKFEYLRELMMLKDFIFWWPMQFIINSTMQYDSFILLTAFTMGYKNCLNPGVNNVRVLTRYVLDKYIRLMPSIMVMVALIIVLPLVYRGPVWTDYVAKQSAVCQSTGWLNTVFLQNYLPFDQICLPQTWLLCVEFQLLLIMAPIVYYLNKSYTSNFGSNTKSILRGDGTLKNHVYVKSTSRSEDSSKAFHWLWTAPGTILAGCVALGLGSSFYSVYYNEFPPSWFYTMADPDSKALYFGEHMTKIWTHLAVFAMGILAGVECRRATKNVYRSYKGSNMNLISPAHLLSKHHHHHNSNSNSNSNHNHHHHQSQISSASSLPIISDKHQGNGNDAISSKMSNSSGNSNAGSSISINIHHNGQTGNSIGGGQYNRMLTSSLAGSSDIQNNDCRARGFFSILLDTIGFILAITIMSAVIFSTHEWSLNDLPKPLIAGIFDAGSRFLWSIAMIWILYMISVPNRDRSFSIVARAFGHPAMVFLGKLSFLIYIIHPFVHTTVLAIQEQPIYSSWLMMFHILIGNMTITVILASFVSLFVEMPCRNLFRRCGTSLLLTQAIGSSSSSSGGGSTTSTNAT